MTISSRFQRSGALAAPGGALSGFGGAVGRAAVRAADLLLTWQERARQRRLLAGLDDRMLDDIGIGHDEVLREADKPFWRA
jgi:uncharacterized protein YjiS (DUF1127 family)